jgi:bacillithiol biosynthesis deacetylase BshB1
MEPVDLLVFGPHPDDIEIGLGGAIAKHAALGHTVGLCDLTAGEMGSNGTIEERLAEAEAARAVLGASWRINLRWPDRAIGRDAEHLRAAAIVIRAARPRAIALPYGADRHPDHVAAHRVLTEAVFSAGLRRFDAGGAEWKADWVCYYFINDSTVPSFVVDVSDHYDRKRQALACHRTQFAPRADNAVKTRLTSPLFLQLVESRDAQFGAQAGVQFAEGVIVRDPIVRSSLFKEQTLPPSSSG